jgi:hypothetical protein
MPRDSDIANQVNEGRIMSKFWASRLVIIAFIAMALSVPIFACQCPTTWPVPSCVVYWHAERVFSGTVSKIEKPQRTLNYTFVITFEIEQTFKGTSTESIDVYFIGGGCELPVKVGEKYLVYADRNPQTGSLELQPCGKTIPLVNAQHDLDYIRSLGKSGQESISGFLLGLSEKDMKDVKVAIEGPQGVLWSQPNAIGYYKFEDVGSGSFRVRISLPFQVSTSMGKSLHITPAGSGMTAEYDVNLEENHCDHRELTLIRVRERGTAVIKGTVLDSLGRPLAGLFPRIYAIGPDEKISLNDYEAAKTDENGRFKFSKIKPGRYVLAIKPNIGTGASALNPLIYFPAASSIQEADKIDVTENAILELKPFILAIRQH